MLIVGEMVYQHLYIIGRNVLLDDWQCIAMAADVSPPQNMSVSSKMLYTIHFCTHMHACVSESIFALESPTLDIVCVALSVQTVCVCNAYIVMH